MGEVAVDEESGEVKWWKVWKGEVMKRLERRLR